MLPVGKNIRILTTSGDVIHSFFIPSLGVQRYAIPGRTIETWVRIDQPGDYYGECNQICGTNHSAMPISIHAVSPDEFTAWLASAKTKFSRRPAPDAARAGGSSGRRPHSLSARTARSAHARADGQHVGYDRMPPRPMTTTPRPPPGLRRSAGCSAPTTRTSARST